MADPSGGDDRQRDPHGLPPLRDDGLPTLPTGEPVLYRWFVIAMLVLVPVALAVTVWAMVSIDREELSPAERRPPGGPTVTIERGDAQLSPTEELERGPACSQGGHLVGDEGARAAARRAMEGACALLATGDFPEAEDGLRAWSRTQGRVRIAAFELSGVESSARLEDDRLVIELNAKFQFEDATRAAPAVLHQLTLLADPDFPGRAISAERELLGARVQRRACRELDLDPPPRGCRDVAELLEAPDPLALLVEAGYERRDDEA